MVTGLTADIFVQLTTTLAHLSGLKNRTSTANLSLPFDLTPKGRNDLIKPQPSPLTSHLKVGGPYQTSASPLTSHLKVGMTLSNLSPPL
jgi:hypothetical protein